MAAVESPSLANLLQLTTSRSFSTSLCSSTSTYEVPLDFARDGHTELNQSYHGSGLLLAEDALGGSTQPTLSPCQCQPSGTYRQARLTASRFPRSGDHPTDHAHVLCVCRRSRCGATQVIIPHTQAGPPCIWHPHVASSLGEVLCKEQFPLTTAPSSQSPSHQTDIKWALHSSTTPHADDADAGTIAASWGGIDCGWGGNARLRSGVLPFLFQKLLALQCYRSESGPCRTCAGRDRLPDYPSTHYPISAGSCGEYVCSSSISPRHIVEVCFCCRCCFLLCTDDGGDRRLVFS